LPGRTFARPNRISADLAGLASQLNRIAIEARRRLVETR
jgi:hypothetical protein